MNYETKKEIEQILLDEWAHISHGGYIFEELNEIYLKAQAFNAIEEYLNRLETPLVVKLRFINSKVKEINNKLEDK